jgi:hypothetical protein
VDDFAVGLASSASFWYYFSSLLWERNLRQIAFGTLALFALVIFGPLSASARQLVCHEHEGYYVNSDGQTIHWPKCITRHESGETAICRDGSHSFSRHHSGTCSHHGGVTQWE